MKRKPASEVYAIQAAKLSTEHLEILLARLTPAEWRKRRAIVAELAHRDELDSRSTIDRQLDSFNDRNTRGV